jgi:RNA polymerase-binding transcription factor DksA
MDLPTQNHLTTLRDLLNYRQAALHAEVHAAQRARQADIADAGMHEVVDHKDEALREQFEDLDRAQEQRDIDELGEVDAALHRLEAGLYGDCVECGEPIALQRLFVQPAALRCASCQAARERLQARS